MVNKLQETFAQVLAHKTCTYLELRKVCSRLSEAPNNGSLAIESRLGERRSGMPDSRPIAGNCYVYPHRNRIEVFSKAQMQRACTIILRVAQGSLPTRF